MYYAIVDVELRSMHSSPRQQMKRQTSFKLNGNYIFKRFWRYRYMRFRNKICGSHLGIPRHAILGKKCDKEHKLSFRLCRSTWTRIINDSDEREP
jgi:hypothetical protein